MEERSPLVSPDPPPPGAVRRVLRAVLRSPQLILAATVVTVHLGALFFMPEAGHFASLAGLIAYTIAFWRYAKLTPSSAPVEARALGLPYVVTMSSRGRFKTEVTWRMIVGETWIDLEPLGGDSMIDPSGPERVPLDEIVLVEPRTSWVALVREREGRRTTFPLRLKYADRKRLLWELAVRVPDALERSLGPKSAATPPVGSAAREAAPAARRDTAAGRPQLPPADHRAPATQPDTSRALDGLDRAMAGLGSSLVAAPARNPAPPASSLGCGLFVAPLRDDDDA